MKRYLLPITTLIVLVISTAAPVLLSAHAQDPVFPLPADLFIVTSEGRLLRIDANSGQQTLISQEEQSVADFAIAPDGTWYAYRTWNFAGMALASLDNMSGSLLTVEGGLPPGLDVPHNGRTIAWAPDATALAYTVPEGLTIAEISAGDYGEPVFSLIRGGPWVDAAWTGPDSVIVGDAEGAYVRITGQAGQWTVESIPGEASPPLRVVPSSLTAQGVTLADDTLIPATAGALTFDWAPLPLPDVTGLPLPADLYYIAPENGPENGIDQVWRLPGTGDAAAPITAENAAVTAYAVAPDRAQIGYVCGDKLVTAALDGSNRRELAALTLDFLHAHLAWSPDGTQIAYHDQRGLWIMRADGNEPPRLLAEHVMTGDVRAYTEPRWSPDGAHLLLSLRFYEGSAPGIVDLADGTITELGQVPAFNSRWTQDGRVLAWASSWGYQTPGLYLIDPAAPDTPPQTLLNARYAVLDAQHTPNGEWVALVGSTTGMGPQFAHLLIASSPGDVFSPAFGPTAGGFVQQAQLYPLFNDSPVIAGLRSASYRDDGTYRGDLVIVDIASGTTRRVQTSGPVYGIQWAP